MVRARSGDRIKQVMKAPARLELRTVAARRAYRTIEQVHVGGERVRLTRIRETHTPRPAIRVTPNGFYFAAAHISQSAFAAVPAQDIDDPVGNIALCDTIECHAHSGTPQRNAARAKLDGLPVDELANELDCVRRRPFSSRCSPAEKMCCIERPQRLHAYVKGAAAERRQTLAQREHRQQIDRRKVDMAVAIQTSDLAIGPVEGKNALQPLNLRGAFTDDPRRGCAVVMVEQQARRRSKRSAVPLMEQRSSV